VKSLKPPDPDVLPIGLLPPVDVDVLDKAPCMLFIPEQLRDFFRIERFGNAPKSGTERASDGNTEFAADDDGDIGFNSSSAAAADANAAG
jgi:hypothetical protein